MNASPTQRHHKVISLLLKAVILIFSFWYIIYKLNGSLGSDLITSLKKANISLLFFTFLLMFFNWGLEALKWKLLIAPLEKISFFTSLKSVFAGVTVSIFMPNRIGEFAGRIFFLQKADKVQATLKNFVGSALQLFMTVFIGIISLFYAVDLSRGYLKMSDVFNMPVALILSGMTLLFIVILFFLNRSRKKFSPKFQSYFAAVFDIDFWDLAIVFLLSFIRYCIFIFQYRMVLQAFGVRADIIIVLVLIAITFLITSVIPSFALTEIVTRGAVASGIFAFVGADPVAVIAASVVVWIINLAFPALIGSAFIWKLKFFKT